MIDSLAREIKDTSFHEDKISKAEISMYTEWLRAKEKEKNSDNRDEIANDIYNQLLEDKKERKNQE